MAERHHLAPTVEAFNALILACAECGQPARAFEVFERMRKDASPDLETYNALASACAAGGDPERAFEVVEQMMPKAGFAANQASYDALILGCVKGASLGRAMQVCRQLEERQMTPGLPAAGALVAALADAGRASEVFAMSGRMQKAGILYADIDAPIRAAKNGQEEE